MPPALSDYGSDDEDGVFYSIEADAQGPGPQSAVRSEGSTTTASGGCNSPAKTKVNCEPATRAASNGRKRSALLAGLDLENIIQPGDESSYAKDTPPTSSIPTSPYKTRSQVHGIHRSELCYNQKYHPMDEFTNPNRAAKMKTKYEDDLLASGDTTTSSNGEANETERETDVDEGPKKARKTSLRSYARPARHPSRRIKRDVLYDANTHPQDAEIEEIEEADQEADAPHRVAKTYVPDSEEETDKENEELEQRMKGDSDLAELIEDAKSDHDNSEGLSSPCKSLPAPVRRHGQLPALDAHHESLTVALQPTADSRSTGGNASRPASNPFKIYEETLEAQLKMEASAPQPLQYGDDDKENDVVNPELQGDPNPNDGITVHPALPSQRTGQSDGLECDESFQNFTRGGDFGSGIDPVFSALPPGMGFDGATIPNTDRAQGHDIGELAEAVEQEDESHASQPTVVN